MGKYFGTDGFRGHANVTLTADKAYRIGRFLGYYYGEQKSEAARIVIGKDTRRSSYMLEYAIAAGITASGGDAYMLHVTTTPSVSYVCRMDGFDCGIMITASHNPYTDNGIKVINRFGEKLDDATTAKIEEYIDAGDILPLAEGEKIGRVVDYVSGRNRYLGYLISLASNSYKHLRIGLDCANGAAWNLARSVFGALGAQLYTVGCEPNGTNINRNCGSTHPDALCRLVRENHLDIGFAFDGDADRCMAVDERGNVVDGDQIMYILARRLSERGMLAESTVVATVMSNSGFFQSLRDGGMEFIQTAVGDRFVYECMQSGDYSLGGEQSGHIIIRKYATTGDGILTAIMVCEEVCDRKNTLSALAAPVKLYPQHTKNVRVTNKNNAVKNEAVQNKVREVEDLIGGRGRVLLRESGTEPVVRIMIECESLDLCKKYADMISDVMAEEGLCCG